MDILTIEIIEGATFLPKFLYIIVDSLELSIDSTMFIDSSNILEFMKHGVRISVEIFTQTQNGKDAYKKALSILRDNKIENILN